MNVEDSVLYCGLDHVFIFIIISHNVILVENNTSERLFTKILHLENIEHNYIIPFACISDWCCCEPELKPGKAARLALGPLGDSSDGSTWGKWTGQGPWLSNRLLSVFFFFTLHFPIKISNLAALFLVKILQGGRRGERRDCYFASCTGQLQGWLFIGEDRLDPLQSQILHLLWWMASLVETLKGLNTPISKLTSWFILNWNGKQQVVENE